MAALLKPASGYQDKHCACPTAVCCVGVGAGEDEDQFEQFMLPLTAAFEAVAQMLSTNTFNEQEAKVTNTHRHKYTFVFTKAGVNNPVGCLPESYL